MTLGFARPKRRRLVIAEWIRDSLDEGTLLDEEGELPRHFIHHLLESQLVCRVCAMRTPTDFSLMVRLMNQKDTFLSLSLWHLVFKISCTYVSVSSGNINADKEQPASELYRKVSQGPVLAG